MGRESGAAGAALFSKKDGPVQNISNIHGKRIGVGVVLGAYQRGFQVLCIQSKACAVPFVLTVSTSASGEERDQHLLRRGAGTHRVFEPHQLSVNARVLLSRWYSIKATLSG